MGSLRIIKNYPELDCAIVAILKDKYFFATGMVPNQSIQAGFISVVDLDNSRKVIANTDLVMVVEHPHSSGNGCKNILFVRMDEHQDHLLGFLGASSIPKEELDKIVPLLFGNESYIRYQTLGVDGVCGALVYKFEIGIPNYTGTTLWILRKKEYENLKNPPPPATPKPTEVKKDAVVDKAATKKALMDEATAKYKIALSAKKIADSAEKRATTAETKASKATQEAAKARGEANAASKVATEAQTAYEQAAAKTT